jgi:lipopolysaccharide export system protein LptC
MVDQLSQNAPQADEHIDLLIRSDETIQLHHKRSKRHSAMVRSMRLLLPIAALGVIVVLMAWKSDNNPVTAIPREQISPQTVSQNELIKPKFQSEDNSGQPYSITADKATQNAEDMNTLFLQKPVADITLKSGGTVSLTAINGEYKQEQKGLSLDGQVEVHNDGGYKIQTEKMNIDVTGQIITSDSPVTGTGPQADIAASGLNVNGNSKILIFTGPAKLTLRKADPTASTPPKDE